MFFTGLTAAVGEGLQSSRQEAAARAEREADREQRLLAHLATSDDPEIASLALAGMLDQTQRKPRKGLRGFLGEMEGHPAIPTIQQLIKAGKATPNAPPEGEVPAALNPDQSAAMPSGSAVTPGGPPMRSLPGPTQFHREERQIFLTPDERARRQQEATVTGKLSAFRTGMREARTPEEQELVRNLSGGPRRTTAYRPVTLELDNGDGTTSITGGYFDPASGGYYDDEYTPLRNVKRIVPNSGAANRPPTNRYITDAKGVVHVVQGTAEVGNLGPIGKPYTPPPAYTGTATIEGEGGDAEVVRLPRGGGEPSSIGTRPAPAGAVSTDQALAQGVVAAIDKAIADARIPGVPIQQGLRDRLVQARNRQFGKTWTYEQWVAQSKINQPVAGVSGGPPPPPKRPAAKGKTPKKSAPASDPLGIRPGG